MNEWMRNRNGELAVALSKKLKLPMYGAYDKNGKCHHIFVMDETLNIGIDARGIVPTGRFAWGINGHIFKPLTKAEVEHRMQQTFPSDIRDARLYIREINVVKCYKMLQNISVNIVF